MSATVSLLGLKRLNEGILGELVVPDGVDIELVKDNLLAETAELEVIYPDAVFMQAMIGRWSAKELPVWDKLYKTTLLQYNPIENYDRQEKWTEDENTSKNLDSEETGSNTTQASDSSKSHGERENNDGTSKYVSAYNETEFTPTERTTGNSQVIGDSNASSESDINTKTKNGLVSDETGKRALDREGSIHGNTGFYTKQKMIEQERSIAEYNIIDVIITSFKNRFCLQVY